MNALAERTNEDVHPETAIARPAVRTRPFYWSVRREVWEHRSLWMAPSIAAGLVLLSFIVNAIHVANSAGVLSALEPQQLQAISTGFYGAIAAVISITMLVVTSFYCLDALYGERRDRSILFWKSLPVSDLTTVTSKLFVAAVLAPAITFVIVVMTQLVILIVGSIIVASAGGSASALSSSLSLVQSTVVLLYSLVAQSIWFLPLTAWLIFVSSWVRRSPVLGAILVPAAVALVERIAFGTSYVVSLLKYRGSTGFIDTAFAPAAQRGQMAIHEGGFNLQLDLPDHIFQTMDPVRFFSSAQVWLGIVIAVALVIATVRLRRYREPL
jgi:ABC-2 type transport system permease protein